MTTIKEIRNTIKRIEGFNVTFLKEDGTLMAQNTKIVPYNYKKMAPSNLTISKFINERIPNQLVEVVDCYGDLVHGRCMLKTIREFNNKNS